MVDRLLADKSIQRLATYASSAFALWAPGVYNYYKERLDKLFQQMPNLQRIFSRSIFPAAAFNFGPKVWTRKHRDVKNCPFGWCSIQALGHFNPKTGGHIVLWELGLAVEFPAASTILIPSATIAHSNLCVAEGEVRASFTQYCSGGLFRYVDYGFRKEKALKTQDPALYKEICRLRPEKWKMGVGLMSTLKGLRRQTL
ncbi:hypothetical protein BYT27DRAFT_7229141 [Phlegmacium glaucopus]|nr:hypothetical protein BYT27DRAFT_7229141 [Phlegmacium glaucopus]